MHDTSDASSFRHQGTHPSADQRSPSATVLALGSALADAATAAMIAPARTAISSGLPERVARGATAQPVLGAACA